MDRSITPRLSQTLVIAAALATLTACSTIGGMMGGMGGATLPSPQEQASQVSAGVRSDADIMGTLHQTNLAEISAGTMAQGRASDQAVRDFAAMMVRDHGNIDRQTMQMAQQWNLTPAVNARLDELARAEMQLLEQAGSGTRFDRVYMASQVMDHERTLALIDASLGMVQRAELRAMLRDQVRPGVAAHLQQARGIQGRIGTP